MPIVLILLAACTVGGVKLDLDGDEETGGGGVDGIEDAEDLQSACEDEASSIQTQVFDVAFEATRGECAWGEDGNLEPIQGVLTARYEQTETLALEDIIVCDMAFHFAGEAQMEQRIVYDDNFIFLMNGLVLASSYRPWIEALESDGTFYSYDWSRIVGMENSFDAGIPTYCAGEDAGLATCDIPPPETRGPISLAFDLSITSELGYRAIDAGEAAFTFIATGDNDPDIDCAHDAFSLQVEVPYLVR